MECQQRVAHGLGGESADLEFAVKFHLALGGMDVHVHGGGIDFDEQAADGIAAFHQRVMIALDERVVDAAIFHRAAVHEHKLAIAGRTGNARRTDESPNAKLRLCVGRWARA